MTIKNKPEGKDEFVKYIVKTNDSNKDNVKLFKAQLTDMVKKIETLEEKFIQEEINRELYDKFLLKYKTEKNNIEEKIGSTRLDLSNLENQIKKYVNICLELPSLWEKHHSMLKWKSKISYFLREFCMIEKITIIELLK